MYGIALLSRYPIESLQIVPMDAPAREQGPEYERRVAILAKVTVAGRALQLIATHLHYEKPAAATMDAQLRAAIEPLLNNQDAVIFGGDMNLLSTDPILKTLAEGFSDSWTALGFKSSLKIDYLFTRNIGRPIAGVEDPNGFSDHPAYWIRVPWP